MLRLEIIKIQNLKKVSLKVIHWIEGVAREELINLERKEVVKAI